MTVTIVLQGKIVAAPAPRVNLDQTVSTTVIVTTVIFNIFIIHFHFHFHNSNIHCISHFFLFTFTTVIFTAFLVFFLFTFTTVIFNTFLVFHFDYRCPLQPC